jgi:hypothetical protein
MGRLVRAAVAAKGIEHHRDKKEAKKEAKEQAKQEEEKK